MINSMRAKLALGVTNIVISIVVLFVSQVIVLSNFDDNVFYSLGFDDLTGIALLEGYINYKKITGASEPTLFLYSYSVNSAVSYGFSILAINILFLLTFYRVLKKYFTPNYELIYAVFLMSNAYMLVLLSDVHRLKLGLVFFCMYLIANHKLKLFFLALSFVSHFQIIIFGLYKIIEFLKVNSIRAARRLFDRRMLIYLGFIAAIIFFNLDYLYEFLYLPILNKILYYLDRTNLNYTVVMSFYMSLFYVPYLAYLYVFRLKETFKKLFLFASLIFITSVVLSFFRLNLLVFGYIYLIELNRLFGGKRYALFPVTGIFFYNIYGLVSFISIALFAESIGFG